MTMYSYRPKGVCSSQMDIVLNKEGIIQELQISSGCDGNLQGIRKLALGQKAEDVAERLQGIKCANKSTSCPDQLSKALLEALEENRQLNGENPSA